jgi:hypothetical protein
VDACAEETSEHALANRKWKLELHVDNSAFNLSSSDALLRK